MKHFPIDIDTIKERKKDQQSDEKFTEQKKTLCDC